MSTEKEFLLGMISGGISGDSCATLWIFLKPTAFENGNFYVIWIVYQLKMAIKLKK